MKKLLIFLAFVPLGLGAQKWSDPEMDNFLYPEVNFINKAPQTRGWAIYDSIVPDPKAFIQQHARWVAHTLYWSDKDNIPRIEKINYSFEDRDGISAKSGGVPQVGIFYSSRWVERSMRENGPDRVLFETRGVLYHELTHAYQANPRGAGTYRQGDEYWVFTEGLADAVRAHNGFFDFGTRRPGGHWMDGYRTTGFFLEWLTSKDPDFIRKFNKTALELDPWSFDAAMQTIFGRQVTTDSLWEEYQQFLRTTARQRRGEGGQ